MEDTTQQLLDDLDVLVDYETIPNDFADELFEMLEDGYDM